jgi:hypothetical protein
MPDELAEICQQISANSSEFSSAESADFPFTQTIYQVL